MLVELYRDLQTLLFVRTRILLQLERLFVLGTQNEEYSSNQANANSDQKIGENDGQDGDDKRIELVDAEFPLGGEQSGFGKLESNDDQNGRKRSHRNVHQQLWKKGHGCDQEKAMEYGRQFGAAARSNVGRTSHDHRRHRQSADQSADHVSDALCPELLIPRTLPLQNVQLIDRLKAEKGFQTGHDRDGQRHLVGRQLGEPGQVGIAQHIEPTTFFWNIRKLYHVDAFQVALPPCGGKPFIQPYTQKNGHQGARNAF